MDNGLWTNLVVTDYCYWDALENGRTAITGCKRVGASLVGDTLQIPEYCPFCGKKVILK